MSNTPTDDTLLEQKPSVASMFRLQFEEAQDSWVLLYPEGMVKLNPSAAEILKRCDGERSISEIIEQLEKEFGAEDLKNDVTSFIDIALEQRWITLG